LIAADIAAELLLELLLARSAFAAATCIESAALPAANIHRMSKPVGNKRAQTQNSNQ